MKPEFILQGTYPYKVIEYSHDSFLVMDMEDREVLTVSMKDGEAFENASIRIPFYNENKLWLSFSQKGYGGGNAFETMYEVEVFFDENFSLHSTDGPAKYVKRSIKSEEDFQERDYYIHGVYKTKPEWFEMLSVEDKKKAVWSFDEDK